MAIAVIGLAVLAELRWPGVLLWLVIGLGLLLGLVAVVVTWAAARRGRDDRDE